MIPTQLWRRLELPGRPETQPDDDLGKLGNWSTAVMATAYGELALFVSQRTRLAIATPLVPINPLVRWFVRRVGEDLLRRGYDRELVDAEVAALTQLRLGRNADRSLTGSINQLLWEAQHYNEPVSSQLEACDLLQARLSNTPHVKRTPSFADQSLALVLATRH